MQVGFAVETFVRCSLQRACRDDGTSLQREAMNFFRV